MKMEYTFEDIGETSKYQFPEPGTFKDEINTQIFEFFKYNMIPKDVRYRIRKHWKSIWGETGTPWDH